MKREITPVRTVEGTIRVPGDKSIAHRAALLSIISQEPVRVINYPDGADCAASLAAARTLGVDIESSRVNELILDPPESPAVEPDTIVDCGNSGTTARLLSGLVSGCDLSVVVSGDESLSQRPMRRIVEPLTEMGAEVIDTEGHLPLIVRGRKLIPFEYRLPVPSAQVKSALLLAGVASGCSVTIREDAISRDHTERMITELGGNINVREIKPMFTEDPDDPRKRLKVMPESFRKEIILDSRSQIQGGTIDIPGDISTAAFFMAAAAISGQSITIENLGLNPTRTGFLEYLKQIGCDVNILDRTVISGEPRGRVIVTGGELKGRRIAGETTVSLIDEIPIVAVLAAFSEGTTVIRDAAELKVKESDRLAAIAHNLETMGISCGLLGDGLVIEGCAEISGADFKTFGDHRIAMAFSIAALFAVGPSSIDDDGVVAVSCPSFYDLLQEICQ